MLLKNTKNTNYLENGNRGAYSNFSRKLPGSSECVMNWIKNKIIEGIVLSYLMVNNKNAWSIKIFIISER